MSDSVDTITAVEGSLLCAERTKSLGVISTNGDIEHSSSESARFRVGDVLLSNGDSYSGSMLGNTPEGSGKYVWSDGCQYEGEWRRGMRHGNGIFRWPSGAVYEGEYSGGYMHGAGTFIAVDKLIYKGRWRLNLKHGLGYQVYPDGDAFEGSWIHGASEGPGKYTWPNGNVYLGNIKAGKMSGKGTLTWTNGDSFEGSWLNGMMHGFGVYSWSDGGCYVGTWTRGLKDGKGSFYPKGNRYPALQELYLNAMRKRGLLPDMKKQKQVSHIHHASSADLGNVKVKESQIGLSDKNLLNLEQTRLKNVALERRWSLEVSIERHMGNNLAWELSESTAGGGNEADRDIPIVEREYMQGVLISELVLNNSLSPATRRAKRRQKKKLTKEINRPGEAIIKGHRSYDLMLSLQLGIRYTVGKITPIQKREVRSFDFGARASFWMNFPREGSQLTPPHQSEDFRWKDYCPMVYRGSRLRRATSIAGDEEVDLLLPGTARLQIQLGVNMPARAERIPGKEDSQRLHEVYDVVLYVGIIDILQDYNMTKKIEHAYKSLQFDSLSISAILHFTLSAS